MRKADIIVLIWAIILLGAMVSMLGIFLLLKMGVSIALMCAWVAGMIKPF